MVDLSRRLPAHALMQKVLQLDYEHGSGSADHSTDPNSWFQGTLGEMIVAGELAQLSAEWTVLHSVPVGDRGSDIDHVVIGPPGVFILNTKNHLGKKIWAAGHGLKVNDRGERYIPVAWDEAQRASALLSAATGVTVPVTSLLVFVGPGEWNVSNPLERGVYALTDVDLLGWLRSRRRGLSNEEVRQIVHAAKDSSTWSRNPLPWHDYRDPATRFNAREPASFSTLELTPLGPCR